MVLVAAGVRCVSVRLSHCLETVTTWLQSWVRKALDTDRRLSFSLPYFRFRNSVSVVRFPYFSVFSLALKKVQMKPWMFGQYISRILFRNPWKRSFCDLCMLHHSLRPNTHCSGFWIYKRQLCPTMIIWMMMRQKSTAFLANVTRLFPPSVFDWESGNEAMDYLCAAHTAPSHSWRNPVERVMSTLNLRFQSVGLMREEMNSDFVAQSRNVPVLKNSEMQLVTILTSSQQPLIVFPMWKCSFLYCLG